MELHVIYPNKKGEREREFLDAAHVLGMEGIYIFLFGVYSTWLRPRFFINMINFLIGIIYDISLCFSSKTASML